MVKSDQVFYKICFDSLVEGICIANQEGRIVMINSAIEEIFGYKKRELIGQKIEFLIPKSLHKAHFEHFNTYVKFPKKYKKGKGREFFGMHKNGSILDLEIGLNHFIHEGAFFAKAVISDIRTRKQSEIQIKEKNKILEKEVKQQTVQLIRVVTDLERSNLKLKEEIKERILAEKSAKKAFEKEKELNAMQTKFMSLASHEFKTPLSGILTSASLIDKYNEINSKEKIHAHTRTIKTLVNQLNSILDDFLFLEKTESDNYFFQLSRFKICELLNRLIEDANIILKEGQRIELETCQESIELMQDRKVIDIIIRNVLYNAIKYSEKDSTIKIKTEKSKNLKIAIIDQGIGIPVDAQEFIFDRFYRAKNVLHIKGTGIGLNIVKKHMEKLNGSVEVKSEEYKGTTVTIKLPLVHKVN
ncbi:PAS domain-containing sensor histidine kinase [Lutimonas halocynthiae]|uniref:PAS domain-containing sensor histidine kinase n=1 Tax=Lutimonas halocynthiae TaxID=1446477 RepID=UPI0025B53967|nr:PAS domain-containing sensor histidine kinase [Lutimonas halocynthiae]MDN3641207.1 PAS domain-containing sensor histidine kinase [Lutimonas halocynthiae]